MHVPLAMRCSTGSINWIWLPLEKQHWKFTVSLWDLPYLQIYSRDKEPAFVQDSHSRSHSSSPKGGPAPSRCLQLTHNSSFCFFCTSELFFHTQSAKDSHLQLNFSFREWVSVINILFVRFQTQTSPQGYTIVKINSVYCNLIANHNTIEDGPNTVQRTQSNQGITKS